MTIFRIPLMVLTVLIFSISTVQAEQVCLPRKEAIRQLAKQFKEKPIGRGLSDDGNAMVELFTSEKGSWTIVVTNTKNISCLVASGQSWTAISKILGQGS